jgi:hypothetical protein
MAKIIFTPQPAPPVVPLAPDFWLGGSSVESATTVVAPAGAYTINIPIPVGVSLGFAIMINVLGLSADGVRTCLQRYTYACFRDAIGVLRADGGFGSGNDIQRMQSLGVNVAEPAPAGGAINADSIDLSFANGVGFNLMVRHQVLLSAGMAIP